MYAKCGAVIMPNMMDARRMWVEALRSGEYSKNEGMDGYLKIDKIGPQYSALGVLCELAVKEGVIKPAKYSEELEVWLYDGFYDMLPEKVQRWVGLSTAWGDCNAELSLSEVDDYNVSFEYTAGMIEEEPDGLFIC